MNMHMEPTELQTSPFAVFVTNAANGRPLHRDPLPVEAALLPAAPRRRRGVCPRSLKALLHRDPSLAETFRRALANAVAADERPADPVVNEYLLRLLREL